MEAVHKEVTLHGLEHTQGIIDGIITELDLGDYDFDIRLILVEAVTNAYYHGNRSDGSKPIHIRYLLRGEQLQLQIEDCGEGSLLPLIPQDICDDHLLDDSGRGLYLIHCLADSVEMIRNTMYISKNVYTGQPALQ